MKGQRRKGADCWIYSRREGWRPQKEMFHGWGWGRWRRDEYLIRISFRNCEKRIGTENIDVFFQSFAVNQVRAVKWRGMFLFCTVLFWRRETF